MTREELQNMINKPRKDAGQMRLIGESYLRGDVLRDPVAAEGWLMKVVETQNIREAPKAMALIAREIMGKEQVFSDEDYLIMKEELETAKGEKRRELEQLLTYATEQQKGIRNE